MTPEEALEYILANWFDGDEDVKSVVGGNEETMAMKTAIEALEKQIPKKPTNYAIDNNGYMIYDCECSSCKCSKRELYPYAYCSHCGQAIDWSDGE